MFFSAAFIRIHMRTEAQTLPRLIFLHLLSPLVSSVEEAARASNGTLVLRKRAAQQSTLESGMKKELIYVPKHLQSLRSCSVSPPQTSSAGVRGQVNT